MQVNLDAFGARYSSRSYCVEETRDFFFLFCLSKAVQSDKSWKVEGAILSMTRYNGGAREWPMMALATINYPLATPII